jgi:hydroxymethylbilane synthase
VTRVLRIGTRGSDLALWQSRRVAALLRDLSGAASELVIVRTSGDADRSRALHELPGSGFFTRELQAALAAGKVDLIVHSLKDLPTDEPAGLAVGAVLLRQDPRELMLARPEAVGPGGLGLGPGVVVGTSSLRRAGQALAAQPDLVIRPLRGNLPTRVQRLREGAFGAILLASAGVERLGLDLQGLSATRFDVEAFVPSPGQGALAIEVREGDAGVAESVAPLHDPGVAAVTACERAVLKGLGGGCHLPLGAFARRSEDGVELLAALADLDDGVTLSSLRRVRVFGADADAAARAALAGLRGSGT